jgi:hypothetical protein
MVRTKYIVPIIFLSNKFNIPNEISKIIHDFIIHDSAQKIIDLWYNYIYIHNIYLCQQVSKLNTLQSYDRFGQPYFYHDINDIDTKITIFTCVRNIRPNISSHNWWINNLYHFWNGLYHDMDHNMALYSHYYSSQQNQKNHIYITEKLNYILGCF